MSYQTQEAKGWSLGKKIIVSLLLTFGLLAGAIAYGLYSLNQWGMSMITNSELFVTAMERVKNDRRVIDYLGEPIEMDLDRISGNAGGEGTYDAEASFNADTATNTSETKGSSQYQGGWDTLDVYLPISGPKAEGILYIVGENPDGKIKYKKLLVESGDHTINVLKK